MTDITIDLNKSEGFVVPQVQRASDWVAGFLSYQDLVAALGNVAEREAGAMLIETPDDLFSRLSSIDPTGWWIRDGAFDDDNSETFTNGPPDKLKPEDARWPNGPDKNLDGTPTGFGPDFYSVLNYLQYGGKCFVVGRTDNLPETQYNLIETLENTTELINCVYTTNPTENNAIMDIAQKRGDCVAICQVNVKAPVSSTFPDGFPTDDDTRQNRNTFHVAGQKVHQGTDINSDLLTTGVAADIAGCMSRVRSSTTKFGSPAGIDAGNILNVVRMQYDLTADDRDKLMEKFVNPVRTFAGLGTSLQGDRTGNKDISQKIFNYLNVNVTYMYINRLISNVVREYMFRENNASTQSSITSSIESILRRVVASGGLKPEYSVICDKTNNPESVVLDGNLVVQVTIAFVLSIQKISLRFRTLSDNQGIRNLNTSSVSGGSSSSTSSTSSTSSSGGSSY